MKLGFAGIIAVAIPALEIVGIYQIGSRIGLLWTLLWLLAAAVAGSALIRQEQALFMPRLQRVMAQGQTPFALLWASGRRFLAGVLLIVPGAFSDFIALLLLLWPGQKLAKIDAAGPTRPQHNRNGNADVIEGEFRRED